MLKSMPPKKKPTTPRTGKKPANPNAVFVRLDDGTASALAAYVADQEVPPERTAVIVTALHQFLAKHGFWPPRPSS